MAELPALLHTLRDHGGMLQTQLAILLLLLTGLPGFLAVVVGGAANVLWCFAVAASARPKGLRSGSMSSRTSARLTCSAP